MCKIELLGKTKEEIEDTLHEGIIMLQKVLVHLQWMWMHTHVSTEKIDEVCELYEELFT